ncbi:uncharacterized protein BX664DRAFT_327612 [Halteromyces radiatus]|uniref:uncharacterized protein n=1 Tax=Halteromyces radiatus TaxID=101107 RepID=UPI00221EBCC4|nr:uncharacterized protein BX664DRAFT_327612 [Halteromyces radiatus]KAI8092568.1 hypothetical protein BX664DRAFT_327612 [Halteromyces radiatus]
MHRRFLSSSASASNYYKITLKRSTIGLSKDYKAAAHTLGLYRLHQTSYQPVNASTAGSILKLKELVKVENVDTIPTREDILASKPARGYKVIGSKI